MRLDSKNRISVEMLQELDGTPNIYSQLASIREASDEFLSKVVARVESILKEIDRRSSGIVFVSASAAKLPLMTSSQLTVYIHADCNPSSKVLATFRPEFPDSFIVSTPMTPDPICPSAVFAATAQSEEVAIQMLRQINAI
jgi:hypothetical protein